jgi:hypothetical protein
VVGEDAMNDIDAAVLTKLAKQRDMLREALECMVREFELGGDSGEGELEGARFFTALRKARTALEKTR